MAIPAFQKVRKNSLSKTVLNDARQIAGAAQQLLLQFPASSSTLTINYNATTGAINYTDATSNAQIGDYLQKVSKGYAGTTIVYNSTVAAGVAAFNLNLNGIGPKDIDPSNATAPATGPIEFDTEGKPL
jgi:hypothetical protein